MEASQALIGLDALEAMSLVELKRVAKQIGVAVSGAKGEVVLRLLQKCVTAADLQKARDAEMSAEVTAMEAIGAGKRAPGGPSPAREDAKVTKLRTMQALIASSPGSAKPSGSKLEEADVMEDTGGPGKVRQPDFGGAALTLESIGDLLDKKLSPLKNSVESVKDDLTSFKTAVASKIDSTNARVDKVSDEVVHLKNRSKAMEQGLDEIKGKFAEFEAVGGPSDESLAQKVESLEKSIQGLRMAPIITGIATSVVGGLQDASSGEVAKQWLKVKLGQKGIEGFIDVYFKGDFKGLLFMKFSPLAMRDAAMLKFNATKNMFSTKVSYMNPQLPIQERAPNTFLNGLKKLLVQWEFTAASVSWDSEKQTLDIEKKTVLKASVKDFVLVLDWVDPSYGTWTDLVDNSEFQALIASVQSKLDAEKRRVAKGKGKGPASA